MAEKRRPWMKWFTRDWRSNAKLRLCSFAARGLWADLLSLMWESPVCGFLMVEGVVPTARQLASLLGGSEREITKLRNELQEAGVFSVTGVDDFPPDLAPLIPQTIQAGVIFSRRMVRDAAKEAKDRENGKGGGNPKLRGSDNGGVNPKANPQRSEARYQNSEPNGSGGAPPGDPVKLLFDAGVELLTSTGCKEPAARSLIGKWRKENGDDAVMSAITEARRLSVTEPISWFTQRFANAKGATRETWDQRRIREGKEALLRA